MQWEYWQIRLHFEKSEFLGDRAELDILGEQGWELVSTNMELMDDRPSKYAIVAFFKRPLTKAKFQSILNPSESVTSSYKGPPAIMPNIKK